MDSKPMRWAELRERVAEVMRVVGCRELNALLADIDAATPAIERQEQLILNLAMLLRRIIHRNRQCGCCAKLGAQASDLLHRKGLQESILRKDSDAD